MFTLIRFVLAVLTVAAYFAKSHIPPKSLVLHPSGLTEFNIYSHRNEDGEFWIRWIDASKYAWRCEFLPSSTTEVCGFAIRWAPKPANCDQTPLPLCASTASDADGDGRGWDSAGICRVAQAGQADVPKRISYPTCSAAAEDQNNDGLSWEAGRTCRLDGHPALEQSSEPPAGEDQGAVAQTGQTSWPVCSPEAVDPDKDGWGWENEQSCTMPSERRCTDADVDYPGATLDYVDLSGFDGIKLSASYEGTADFLSMYLINRSSESGRSYSDKFMSAFIPTLELKTGAVYIPLQDFKVELWWEMQNNPRRAHAGLEFNRISTIGIDPAEYGIHRMQVDRLELVGERFSSRAFLIALLSIWAGYLIFEAVFRYARMRSSVTANQKQIETLSDSAQHLKQEQATLQTRSVTDPLTQVYNRAGAAKRLRELFGAGPLPPKTGLMVLDIDHFKAINDTHGHEAGDIILKEFSKLVLAAVRADDLVARWGGEEFIVVLRNVKQAHLMTVAEKLRSATGRHAFTPGGITQVTVSIGVTITERSENFEQTFKRADEALYRAKHTRNTVVYG